MNKNNVIELQKRISELEKKVEELKNQDTLRSTKARGIISEDAQKIILENEEKFKSLFNGITLPVFVHPLKSEGFTNFIEVNSAALKKYGYTRDEFLRLSPKDISAPEDSHKKGSAEARQQLKAEGQAIFEATHLTKDGKKIAVEISSNIYNWLGQKVILSVAQNITELKEAEKNHHEALAVWQTTFDAMSDSVSIIDMEGNIIQYNAATLKILNATDEQVKNNHCWQLVHRTNQPIENCPIVRMKKSKQPESMIYQENDRWLEISVDPIFSKNGKLTGAVHVVSDVTVRMRAEDALHESEEKYRHLIEESGDAIYFLYNRRFEIVNKKFTQLFGITIEQANSPDFDFMNLVSPDSRSLIEERIQQQAEGKVLDPKYEFKAINTRGQVIIVETSVTHIKYKQGVAAQGIIRDITENRRLEQQLQQAQKMEAIGTLAGGVAHDFNNLLTVINGYSELALLEIDKQKLTRLHKITAAILNAGQKAENLTRQLLAFSRKQIYKTEVVNINEIILSMDKMLGRLIGEDISVKTVLADEVPIIMADTTQLEQIVINLIVNARDALYAVPDREFKKKITIETGYVILDEEFVKTNLGSVKGAHIFFAISDNGIGMDEHTKQKIFEPFFTTKDKLKGTGLGLSTVYGIVKQNNGYVSVYSEPGQGTTFKIYWPFSKEETVSKTTEKVVTPDLSGSESILLVEDDTDVCEFATAALQSLGYQVSQANNGNVALNLIQAEEFKFDLIITDLIMPELNGKDFIEKAKQIIPDIKVIFVSGYTNDHIAHNGLLDDDINFIPKPYSIKTLAGKVKKVLN